MYENPEFQRIFLADRNRALQKVADRQRYTFIRSERRDRGWLPGLICALGRGLISLGATMLAHYDATPEEIEPLIRRKRAT